jgi:N-acetyl sugar amidotransferase
MTISESNFQVCARCVMDTTALDIEFDDSGVCNYCTEFLVRSGHIINNYKSQNYSYQQLEVLIKKIKKDGLGKKYDCIIGVSGGVDSSWVLVKAVELGLRPLAVHMDNGWNSELAQNNIANLVNNLKIDLHTHVIDWTEYKSLMQAFFDADVVDVELLYDNAMLAVNYEQASKYGLKFILSGSNQATEGMKFPIGWNWFKFDKRNIYSLARLFGQVKIKTFPSIGTLEFIYYGFIKKLKWIPFLDNFVYNKFAAIEILQTDYGYKPYPYKHYESIFTRFYQGYILPNKFAVDKRKLHLSTLVVSGQITREEAILGINGLPYPSEKEQQLDIKYFLKKMNWSEADLANYISRPRVEHDKYPSEKKLWDFALNTYKKWIAKRKRH